MFKYSKLICLIAVSTLIASCGKESVTGTGVPKSDVRHITSTYTSLIVNGTYLIDGATSASPNLTITTNENLLPYIVSNVSSGTLTIENKKDVDIYPTTQQSIKFTTKDFDSLTLNGHSTFSFANLKTQKLMLNLTGSNSVKISGQGYKLDITVNGSGEVDTRNFKVDDGRILINGDAIVYVNATKYLDVTINGNGKIVSLGGTPKIKQTINGAGQIVSDFGGT